MTAGSATWKDLSHPIGAASPRVATFPSPVTRRLLQRPDDPLQVTALDLCCHVGTHVDAPVHFVEGGASIDEIPLDRWCGPGVVLDLECRPEELIDVAALEAAGPEVLDGDIVLLCTGWDEHVGTPLYDRHPSLTVAAAQWLTRRAVKLLGVDFGTPDLPLHRRESGFDWLVHQVLLGRGTLVAEHLCNLKALAGSRVEISCAPINVEGADGAPARILAREVHGA